MDRKDFLKYSGLIILGVFGFRGIISLLSGDDFKNKSTAQIDKNSGRGFGGGRYGV